MVGAAVPRRVAAQAHQQLRGRVAAVPATRGVTLCWGDGIDGGHRAFFLSRLARLLVAGPDDEVYMLEHEQQAIARQQVTTHQAASWHSSPQ